MSEENSIRSTDVDKHYGFTSVYYPPVGTPLETLGGVTLKRETSTVNSFRGPRKKKDAYGWEPPNPFSLQRFRVNYGPVKFVRTGTDLYNRSYKWTTCGYPLQKYWPSLRLGAQLLTTQEADAITNMSLAQHQAYGEANSPACPGLTWLAEAKELVLSLGKLASKSISMGLRAQARVDFLNSVKSIKNKADQIADTWLQYRYAVMPLLLQIQDIVDLLTEKQTELKKFSGYVKSDYSDEPDIIKATYYNTTMTFLKTREYKIRGATQLFPAALKDENDYGVTPFDVVLTSYELLTLSFVLDWFFGIGDWLSAFRPGGATIAHQTSTYVVECKETIILSEVVENNPVGYKSTMNVSPSVAKTTTVVRNINHGFESKLPVFDNSSLALVRQLDAVALIFKFGKSFFKRK